MSTKTTTQTASSPPTDSNPDSPPTLTTSIATSKDDLIASLQLVADSIAQQRQVAARSIIFHPLWLGTMTLAVAIIYQLMYNDSSDLALIGTTGAGCLMAGLVIVRAMTGKYIELAESVGTWAWLEESKENEQVVLVTRFGEKVIGTVVLRVTPAGKEVRKRGQKSEAVVRAWTVQQRYRGHGVGRDLLEEAVRVCKGRGWEGPVFEEETVHSKRILPALFHGGVERREQRAKALLAKLVVA